MEMEKKNTAWSYAICFLALSAMIMAPEASYANGDAIGSLLCTVVGWFTGTIGQGLATLAIIVIGVGALMGKVSWGMAIIVGVGVAVIFGAPSLVNSLAPEGTTTISGCATVAAE